MSTIDDCIALHDGHTKEIEDSYTGLGHVQSMKDCIRRMSHFVEQSASIWGKKASDHAVLLTFKKLVIANSKGGAHQDRLDCVCWWCTQVPNNPDHHHVNCICKVCMRIARLRYRNIVKKATPTNSPRTRGPTPVAKSLGSPSSSGSGMILEESKSVACSREFEVEVALERSRESVHTREQRVEASQRQRIKQITQVTKADGSLVITENMEERKITASESFRTELKTVLRMTVALRQKHIEETKKTVIRKITCKLDPNSQLGHGVVFAHYLRLLQDLPGTRLTENGGVQGPLVHGIPPYNKDMTLEESQERLRIILEVRLEQVKFDAWHKEQKKLHREMLALKACKLTPKLVRQMARDGNRIAREMLGVFDTKEWADLPGDLREQLAGVLPGEMVLFSDQGAAPPQETLMKIEEHPADWLKFPAFAVQFAAFAPIVQESDLHQHLRTYTYNPKTKEHTLNMEGVDMGVATQALRELSFQTRGQTLAGNHVTFFLDETNLGRIQELAAVDLAEAMHNMLKSEDWTRALGYARTQCTMQAMSQLSRGSLVMSKFLELWFKVVGLIMMSISMFRRDHDAEIMFKTLSFAQVHELISTRMPLFTHFAAVLVKLGHPKAAPKFAQKMLGMATLYLSGRQLDTDSRKQKALQVMAKTADATERTRIIDELSFFQENGYKDAW